MKTIQAISHTRIQTNIAVVDAKIFLDFNAASLALTEPYSVGFVLTSLETFAKVVNTDQCEPGEDGEKWAGFGIELVEPVFAPAPSWFEDQFNPEVLPMAELPF